MENKDESYDIGQCRFGTLKERGVYLTAGKTARKETSSDDKSKFVEDIFSPP